MADFDARHWSFDSEPSTIQVCSIFSHSLLSVLGSLSLWVVQHGFGRIVLA
jgi:hypothetical protein